MLGKRHPHPKGDLLHVPGQRPDPQRLSSQEDIYLLDRLLKQKAPFLGVLPCFMW